MMYVLIDNDSLTEKNWADFKESVLTSGNGGTLPNLIPHGQDISASRSLYEGGFLLDKSVLIAALQPITGGTVTAETVTVYFLESASDCIRLFVDGARACRVYLLASGGNWAASRLEAVAAKNYSILPGSGVDHYVNNLAAIAGLAEGDIIFVERGRTFSSTLIVDKEAVTVQAYGTGDRPLFNLGITYGAGWEHVSGNIWSHARIPSDFSNYDGAWCGDYAYAMSETYNHMLENSGCFFTDTEAGIIYFNFRDGDTKESIVIRDIGAAIKIRAAGCSVVGIESKHGVIGFSARATNSYASFIDNYVHHCSYFGIDSYAPHTSVKSSVFEYCGCNRGGGGTTCGTSTATYSRITNNIYRHNGGHPVFFVNGVDDRNWGCGPQVGNLAHYSTILNNTILAADTGIALDIGINFEGGGGWHYVSGNHCSGGHTTCINVNNCPGAIIENNTLKDYAEPQHITRVGSGIKIIGASPNVQIFSNRIETLRAHGAGAGLSPIFTGNDLLRCDCNSYYQPNMEDRIANLRGAWLDFDRWRLLGYDANSPRPSK